MNQPGFLDRTELAALGLAAFGENVLISRRASLHGVSRIRLGSNVRIDDFCVLSAGAGGIEIGSYVHVAVFCLLIGAGSISVGDFANISSRVSVYTSSDDYSGTTMTNPMIPDQFRAVDTRPVEIGRHVIIGSGSVVLPGVELGEGCAIGALSLVTGKCQDFTIYAGVPAVDRGKRKTGLLALETEFRSTWP
jgi:dTDP-4-amino-4,6-dideoxy-D-glucose acyltransferase